MTEYSRQSLLFIVVMLSVVSLSSVRGNAEPPLSDPIEWTEPAQRPEFRELLTGQTYEKRFEEALEKIGSISDLEASHAPSAGIRVVKITPGEPADRLGISVGDTITHCNGHVMWNAELMSFYSDQEREIQLVTSSGDVRTVQLPTGRVGVFTQPSWHPEMHYLREGNRDPQWDREVIVGIVASMIDPDLAETCWAHAINAGYPRDLLSAFLGTVLSVRRRPAETTADFAYFCLNQSADNQLIYPYTLYRAEMANFKLKHALELVENYPALFYTDVAPRLREMITLHESRPQEERCAPSPGMLSEQMYRDDIFPSAVPLNDDASVIEHVERLRVTPNGELAAATAHYALAAFGPRQPAKNIDLQVQFRLKPTDEETSEFLKCFECALEDMEHWDSPDRSMRSSELLLLARLREYGVGEASAGGISSFQYGSFNPIEGTEANYSVRLVRVEGQGEVFINGIRVMYTPIDNNIDFVAIVLKSVGMTVDILDLEATELIERL